MNYISSESSAMLLFFVVLFVFANFAESIINLYSPILRGFLNRVFALYVWQQMRIARVIADSCEFISLLK